MSTRESDGEWKFRIPKRKADEMSPSSNGKVYRRSEVSDTNDPCYNSYEQSGPWQQESYSQSQCVSRNSVEPITQNICNTLSNIKEKPKNYFKNIFKETAPDVEDTSLPKELISMFQPLYCKLCTAHLSSNVMAKLHYKSKNHEKKIRKFLVEYSEKTGEPLHKRARVAGTPKSEDEQNPRWFHCDICDLPLTGKMHAESHYMGRNHQKAIMGYKAPAGKGFYNDEGKWVRATKKEVILQEGEDNFGLDFRKQKQPEVEAKPVVPASDSSSNSTSLKFHCVVCNVGATCQEQIEMHFKGQKHQKKIRQMGLQSHLKPDSAGSQGSVSKSSHGSKNADSINMSVYRTPSGDFYCPICNLTLNSEPQFKIHLRSKGHMKKSQQKQRD